MPEQNQLVFGFPAERHVWTVSALVARLRQQLERDYFDIWIEGEISNLRQSAARHYYFVLKDARAQLRAVLFASAARSLKLPPRDGLVVRARCRINVYEARGELQCEVEWLEPVGEGALQAAFEQLKQKLEAEGLFARARKRPLPLLPRRLGLITSPRGAALADLLRVLRRRYPNLDILLYPVQVQGASAPAEICAALDWFAASRAAEVLILARGGGSLEDLQAFNQESVARAIARSPLPVISAVGHETDFTIADFVADLRAPTPSAAAEMVIRPKQEWLSDWSDLRRRLLQQLRYRLVRFRRELDGLTRFEPWRARLRQQAQQLDDLGFRLQRSLVRSLHARRRLADRAAARVREHSPRNRLERLARLFEARQHDCLAAYRLYLTILRRRFEAAHSLLVERNPIAILNRGYALVYDLEGRIVSTPSAVQPGEGIQLQFATGWLEAEVKRRRLDALTTRSPVKK